MKKLEDVLRCISESIEIVRLCKCDSAASLLEMAELELRMKVHDISEAELTVFCRELENRIGAKSGAQIIELRPKIAKVDRRKSP